MKHLLLTTAAFVAFGAAAHAADVPASEPAAFAAVEEASQDWSGFYVGAHGGYSFGDNDDNELEFDTDGDGDFDDTVFTAAGADAFGPGFDSDFEDGFNGGVKLGYDQQFGSFVFGVVGDISYVDVEDSVSGFSTTPAEYTFERELEFLATGRLRGGYAFDNFLVYATGGVAYGEIDFEFSTDSPAVFAGTSGGDEEAWGYTVGAGVEMMVSSNVSVGLEYLYTDLDADTETATFTSGPFAPSTDMRPEDDEFDFHTVRAQVSYRF